MEAAVRTRLEAFCRAHGVTLFAQPQHGMGWLKRGVLYERNSQQSREWLEAACSVHFATQFQAAIFLRGARSVALPPPGRFLVRDDVTHAEYVSFIVELYVGGATDEAAWFAAWAVALKEHGFRDKDMFEDPAPPRRRWTGSDYESIWRQCRRTLGMAVTSTARPHTAI